MAEFCGVHLVEEELIDCIKRVGCAGSAHCNYCRTNLPLQHMPVGNSDGNWSFTLDRGGSPTNLALLIKTAWGGKRLAAYAGQDIEMSGSADAMFIRIDIQPWFIWHR